MYKNITYCTFFWHSTWINTVPTLCVPHFGGHQLRDIERPKNDLRTTSDVEEANRALDPKGFSEEVWPAAALTGASEWNLAASNSFKLPRQVPSKQY